MSNRYVTSIKTTLKLVIHLRGFLQDEKDEGKYTWLGYSFEKMQEVLLEIITEKVENLQTDDVLWNICVYVLIELVTSKQVIDITI